MFRFLPTLLAMLLVAPCWLAGGQTATDAAFPGTNGRIVFASGTDSVMTMDLDGGSLAGIPSSLDYQLEPAFGPDGRTIVFRGLGSGGDADGLYVTLGGPPTKIPNTEGNFYDPSFAPDGGSVSFDGSGVGGAADIWAINTDGGGLRNLTQSASGNEYVSTWSPDGQKIAYVRQEQGACCDSDIWVMDANGDNQMDVTNTPGVSEAWPDWSPDSARIIFSRSKDIAVSGTPQTPGDIAVMNADGSDYNLVTTDDTQGQYDPAFSPDGQQIVYQQTPASVAAAGFESAIVVANVDGSHPITISSPGVNYSRPDWGLAELATTLVWGDNNCSGAVSPADVLPAAFHMAGLPPIFGSCPAIGETGQVAGWGQIVWGDLDCSGSFEAPDLLLLLKKAAGLPPAGVQNCPALGVTVILLPPG